MIPWQEWSLSTAAGRFQTKNKLNRCSNVWTFHPWKDLESLVLDKDLVWHQNSIAPPSSMVEKAKMVSVTLALSPTFPYLCCEHLCEPQMVSCEPQLNMWPAVNVLTDTTARVNPQCKPQLACNQHTLTCAASPPLQPQHQGPGLGSEEQHRQHVFMWLCSSQGYLFHVMPVATQDHGGLERPCTGESIAECRLCMWEAQF